MDQAQIENLEFAVRKSKVRLWGSSRFMSPEEFVIGSEIDSQTNVLTMGAIAFGLLGGELDRSIVACNAVEKDKIQIK